MPKDKADAQELVRALREAGNVRRCHTMVWLGPTYTVGAHSYHALNLLLVLHPNPPLNLIKAVMWHDVPERWLGDVPAPAKWADGEFAKTYERLERRVHKWLGTRYSLSAEERMWLQAVDKMELLFAAKEQVMLGNQNANAIIGALAQWFSRTPIPDPCAQFVNDHKAGRHHDGIPGEAETHS